MLVAEPAMLDACLSGLGTEEAQGPSEDFIRRVALAMMSYLGAKPMAKDGVHDTELNVELYDAWARTAHDPDEEVLSWLVRGAPLGIADKFQVQQVFPEVGTDAIEHEVEATDWASFANYSSVDGDVHAMTEIDRLVRLGYLRSFGDLEQCRAFVLGEPVLSKLGLISKEVVLVNGQVKTKRRLILDCRRST
eukprot:968500-Amphidinium_carterae.1